MNNRLISVLKKNKPNFHQVTPFDLNKDNPYVFDLTNSNEQLIQLDLNNEGAFNSYIFDLLKAHHTEVGIGRYNEDREIYKRSDVFAGEKVRSVHLGIDIWASAGTAVYAPLDGVVHSFANNAAHGDYGPTIILKHELEGEIFHTLYGHLSLDSIENIAVEQKVIKGQQIASFGDYSINVHWPPHLHFQIVIDMKGKEGDYPGVASLAENQIELNNCPDPNLILGMN